MSRSIVRQCIAYLLIALLPLQAAAASRLALCAEMGTEMGARQMDATKRTEHCAQMGSMEAQTSSEQSSASHHNSGCWLGSTCLVGMILMAVPVTYSSVDIPRNTPSYLAPTTLYLSIISENPLRPPTTL